MSRARRWQVWLRAADNRYWRWASHESIDAAFHSAANALMLCSDCQVTIVEQVTS